MVASGAPYDILHTTRSLRIDGVTNVVLRNVSHLDRDRFVSHVCSLRNDDHLAPQFREHGIEPVFLGHRGPASIPGTVAKLVRLIRDRRIRLVHTHRTVDLGIAGLAACICGVPLISTIHWIGPQSYPENVPMWQKRSSALARALLDRMFARQIVVVSEAVRASYAGVPFFPLDRTALVYPGLDMAEGTAPDPAIVEELRSRLALDGTGPVLLNIGRLDEVKGQIHLIPMMLRVRERLPAARLLIAGDGELRGRLTRAVTAAGLDDAVTFLGARTDIDELLAVSDLLVVTSESEAVGLPPLEAMRRGKPVVATGVGGIPEILDGGGGIVVPRGDAAALAGAVVEVLAVPGRAEEMGAAGVEFRHGHVQVDRAARDVNDDLVAVLD